MATATVFNEDPADQARVFAERRLPLAACRRSRRRLRRPSGQRRRGGRHSRGRRSAGAARRRHPHAGDRRRLARARRPPRRLRNGGAALPGSRARRVQRFPGRIAVGIDARDGRVAVQGWSEQSDISALDLARRFEDAGVAAIVFTDIGRDGVLAGPNIGRDGGTGARRVDIPVILSGGISSLADLQAVKAAGDGIIAGVICGRAIYDGRIDVAQAVALLGGGRGRGEREPVLKVRIIPCLDVDARARGQGRPLRRSGRCRRPGRAGAGLRCRPAPTNSASSTSPPATRTGRRSTMSFPAPPSNASCR